MKLSINKLVVSVMIKLAPQLSPLCPPKDLYIRYGINIEVSKPEEKQVINSQELDRLKFSKNRKYIIAKKIIIKDGLSSLDNPFQYFLCIETDLLLKRYS